MFTFIRQKKTALWIYVLLALVCLGCAHSVAPVPTPTQSVTPEPASVSTLPDTVSTVVSGIPVTAYYVAGGLALILIVLVVVLASRRKRGGR